MIGLNKSKLYLMYIMGASPKEIIEEALKEVIGAMVMYYLIFGEHQYKILIGRTKLLTYDKSK